MKAFVLVSCSKTDLEPDSIHVGEGKEGSFEASVVGSEWCLLTDFFAINDNCNGLPSNQVTNSCSKRSGYSIFFFRDRFKWEVEYCE